MKFKTYLDLVNDFKTRRCLARFRLGVHDLETERGRYARKPLPITERRCKLCLEWMIQAVENEEHFLLHCPFYLKQRTKLYGTLRQMHYNINETNDVEEFTWLLSQETIIVSIGLVCTFLIQ